MEQEAIVSRIWALGAEAGHRSHEGANAHSALVDWSWPYPQPAAEPPVTFLWLGHAVFMPVPPTVLASPESSHSNAAREGPIHSHLHGGDNSL